MIPLLSFIPSCGIGCLLLLHTIFILLFSLPFSMFSSYLLHLFSVFLPSCFFGLPVLAFVVFLYVHLVFVVVIVGDEDR